ncbi:MAG TPA: hypothetical protein VEX68_23405 [Bryobacteraceae bacterium]|nr:hypothetical protein [Bryobacteraceae bacterium]
MSLQKLPLLFDRAIVALMSHARVTDAAKSINIAPETLRSWLKKPEFSAALDAAREEALSETINQLRLASQNAVKALSRNLRCGVPAAEIAAARAILDAILKPSGIPVEGGQTPLRIEIVYAPQVNINEP